MRVLGARCIVKEEKNEGITKSGLLISGKEKEPTYRGKIISIGEGALLENGNKVPMSVKVGDTIIYTAFSGSEIIIDGESFIILNERDILCVLD